VVGLAEKSNYAVSNVQSSSWRDITRGRELERVGELPVVAKALLNFAFLAKSMLPAHKA
jgi:hypothetical protein